MTAYGYIRVSTAEQNEDRQLLAMQEIGISSGKIFMDKQSGKDFNRPQYKKLMRKLKSGYTVYQKHRPIGTKLRGNSESVADYNEREKSRYCCD